MRRHGFMRDEEDFLSQGNPYKIVRYLGRNVRQFYGSAFLFFVFCNGTVTV